MAVKGAAAWARTIPIGAGGDKATEVTITAWTIDPVTYVGKHTEPAIELLIPEPPIELPSRRKVSWRNKCFNAVCHRYHNRFLQSTNNGRILVWPLCLQILK